MKIYTNKVELQQEILRQKADNKSIGFVPTMGALHPGHMSLIRRSVQENDLTVASIFVNPTQFNDKNDLLNYPRMMDQDLELLEKNGCSMVFTPSVEEMYPEADHRKFDFGPLEQVMEGLHRPGHFNGVALIVSKLFEAVPAQKAYFGDKDFQQVAIIHQLVKMLQLPVQIVPCPIFREEDGLAMSSRNMLLSDSQRKSAPLIYRTLAESKEKAAVFSLSELKAWVIQTIDSDPELKTEYFEIVDEMSLQAINSWDQPGKKVGCIAVKVGKIRLIDNIRY